MIPSAVEVLVSCLNLLTNLRKPLPPLPAKLCFREAPELKGDFIPAGEILSSGRLSHLGAQGDTGRLFLQS